MMTLVLLHPEPSPPAGPLPKGTPSSILLENFLECPFTIITDYVHAIMSGGREKGRICDCIYGTTTAV